MLSINFWNILWTVVNLLVLYVVFRKFLYQRVMNVIEAREEMVKKQFDDAKKSELFVRKAFMILLLLRQARNLSALKKAILSRMAMEPIF